MSRLIDEAEMLYLVNEVLPEEIQPETRDVMEVLYNLPNADAYYPYQVVKKVETKRMRKNGNRDYMAGWNDALNAVKRMFGWQPEEDFFIPQ